MSIIYVQGDLLESDCDIICHGCNCWHVMGGGIAAQIKRKYPEAYKADLMTQKGDRNKLGDFSIATLANSQVIINMYTQYSFGTGLQTDYKAIRSCFKALNRWFHSNRYEGCKIGIPRIGAGLGGGDWNIISKIIEEEVKDPIYCYTL